MGGFAKLFSSIVASSVWSESDSTRIVWISLLALADRNGEVASSIPGLARLANVSRERCEEALAVLSAPDPDDRSGVNDGRRIQAVPGGWRIVNYLAYRERGRGQDRAEYLRQKQRESRARRQQAVNKSTNVNQRQPIAEAEIQIPEEARSGSLPLPVALDTPEFLQAWTDWQAYRRESKLSAWKPRTVAAKLAELESWGSARAVAAIRRSISNGWQGIFDREELRRPGKASAVDAGGLTAADLAALAKKEIHV